ncbi:unnamed protein product, partial [Rotaria socialis]
MLPVGALLQLTIIIIIIIQASNSKPAKYTQIINLAVLIEQRLNKNSSSSNEIIKYQQYNNNKNNSNNNNNYRNNTNNQNQNRYNNNQNSNNSYSKPNFSNNQPQRSPYKGNTNFLRNQGNNYANKNTYNSNNYTNSRNNSRSPNNYGNRSRENSRSPGNWNNNSSPTNNYRGNNYNNQNRGRSYDNQHRGRDYYQDKNRDNNYYRRSRGYSNTPEQDQGYSRDRRHSRERSYSPNNNYKQSPNKTNDIRKIDKSKINEKLEDGDLCPKCSRPMYGIMRCADCEKLCFHCKSSRHKIAGCPSYKVIMQQYKRDPKNNFHIIFKEDKKIIKSNEQRNKDRVQQKVNKKKFKVVNNNSNVNNEDKEKIPNIFNVKKVKTKNVNSNYNNKTCNILVKRTPEKYLNPENDPNFKLKLNLKSNLKSPTNEQNKPKKQIRFNRENKLVKFGSFWEPSKLSNTAVEKKIYVKFNKKFNKVDYEIDTNELKSEIVKSSFLQNLKQEYNNEIEANNNVVISNVEFRKENKLYNETELNTKFNKANARINEITRGELNDINLINTNWQNIDKIEIPIEINNNINVNFSSFIINNNNKFNVKKSKVKKNKKKIIKINKETKFSNTYSSKNNYINYQKFINKVNNSEEKLDENLFNAKINFTNNFNKIINNNVKPVINLNKLKVSEFNSNKVLNLNKLNNIINSNYYMNKEFLKNNLNRIIPMNKINEKLIKLTINKFMVFKFINNYIIKIYKKLNKINKEIINKYISQIILYIIQIVNNFNSNELLYVFKILNQIYLFISFNLFKFKIDDFINLFKPKINKIYVKLNYVVEGTGENCTNHNCTRIQYEPNVEGCNDMETKAINILTKKQSKIAINGIPRQNCWIMANKEPEIPRTNIRPDILTFFITINNKPCKALIDSGAQISSMTKSGLEYFNLPSKKLEKNKYFSIGIGGRTPITEITEANVICHDLKFPKHPFKIIDNSNPDYFVTLGSDWLKENKTSVDPFNLSIGCQIDKDSYWELFCNTHSRVCRRVLRNIDVYSYTTLTPKENMETISNFNIVLPNVEITEYKNCLCQNQVVDQLNSFIYFSSNFENLDNLENLNNEENKNNLKNEINNIQNNIIIKSNMTNIYSQNFSVIKGYNNNYFKLPRGTKIGTVSTPYCKENDKNYPVRLNNKLNEKDVEFKDSLTINNTETVNISTFSSVDIDYVHELNYLKNIDFIYNKKHHDEINVQYDLLGPPPEEETKQDDPELPKLSAWTKETLNDKLQIFSKNYKHKAKLQDLLYNYKEVFSQTDFSKEASLEPLTVELTDQVPIFIPQYRFAPQIEDAVQAKVNELIEQKQVVPSKSRYNFPILPIKKRSGANTVDNIRIVLDLRLLNKKSIKFEYPIPDINLMLQKLGGFKLYTSLDFTNGFWQLPLDKESQKYMAFSTATGRYQLTRAPQGFINTAAAFQSSVNYVFGDLLFPKEIPVTTIINGKPVTKNITKTRVFSYIDDVVILGENEEVMEYMLELVLQKLKEYELKLKISKCHFSNIKLDFVGHEISELGIRKQSKYVDKVLKVPRPETIKDLLKFMGMANWVSKFCKDFSKIARPLSALQKTDKKSMKLKIEWDDEKIKSFEGIKDLIRQDIILAYPKPESECGELQLFCDSSDYCIGSCLCQYQPVKNDKGEEEMVLRTIANYSCVLNKHACKYNIREKELTSIRLSLEHFKPYLMGRQFNIFSDHKSLIYLNTMKLINTRLFRTAQELACFDYKICYLPGKDNFYADILSRLPYDEIIKKTSENYSDKLPDNCMAINIPGGGDSLIICLSKILFNFKKLDKKIDICEEYSDKYVNSLREKLHKNILGNPNKYGINLTADNRKQWNAYGNPGENVPDQFIQCFVNMYKCEIELYFSDTSPIIFKCDDFKKLIPNRIGRLQIKGGTHFNLVKLINNDEYDKGTHVMFYKQYDSVKNDTNKKIISIKKTENNNIIIKHSNMETIIDKLDRKFSNKFEEIHNSYPLQSYKCLKNNISETVNCENLINTSDDYVCNHKNYNHSMSHSMFRFNEGDKFCTLFDTCSSINLMSESLADFLFSKNLLQKDNQKIMNIICSGGKEIKVVMKFVYAEPYLGYEWSFRRVRFGVVKDELLPCCSIMGFEFMSRNRIILNFLNMSVDMSGEQLVRLGIYNANPTNIFQPNYNNSEYIFRDEIEEYESKIEKLPIEIVSTYKKYFTKDLLNLKVKQLIKKYNSETAPAYIKELINKSKEDTSEHCITVANSHLGYTKPILKFVDKNANVNEQINSINDNKKILNTFQVNYRDTEEYKKMPYSLKLYCAISHEKMMNLYNKYLEELKKANPNTSNNPPTQILEPIDHVRIHPKLNFILLNKLEYIDKPTNVNLMIKKLNKDKNNNRININFETFENKYKLKPDYIKLTNNRNIYCSNEIIPEVNVEESNLEIIKSSLFNASKRTANDRKSLIDNTIRNNQISYKERCQLIKDSLNLEKLKLHDEILRLCGSEKQIADLQSNDFKINKLKNAVQYYKDQKWTGLKEFHSAKRNFFIIRDMLIWYRAHDNKILPVIPKNYLIDLIINTHINMHEGSEKTHAYIKKHFYHPKIYYYTNEITSCCYLCQIAKPQTGCNPPKLDNLEATADFTFDRCMADLTWLPNCKGYVGIFNIIDVASRKCFSAPIKNKTTKSIIEVFKEIFIPQFNGKTIKILRADNGTEFSSNEFRKFCESIGTKLTFSNPYNSKGGAKVERVHQSIQQSLRMKLLTERKIDWISEHRNVVESYNNSPHSKLNNYSPNNMFLKLLHDYENKIPITVKKAKDIISNQPGFPYFKVNDWVLKTVHNIGRRTEYKLQPIFEGPYRIIEEYERKKSYIIQSIKGNKKRACYDQIKHLKFPPDWLIKIPAFQLNMWDDIPKFYKEEDNLEYNQHYYRYNNDYNQEDNSARKYVKQKYHNDYSFSPVESIKSKEEFVILRTGYKMPKPKPNDSAMNALIWDTAHRPQYDNDYYNDTTDDELPNVLPSVNYKNNNNMGYNDIKSPLENKTVKLMTPLKVSLIKESPQPIYNVISTNLESTGVESANFESLTLNNSGIDNILVDPKLQNENYSVNSKAKSKMCQAFVKLTDKEISKLNTKINIPIIHNNENDCDIDNINCSRRIRERETGTKRKVSKFDLPAAPSTHRMVTR